MANRLIRMLCVLPPWLFLALFLCSMVGAANTPKPGVLRLVTESWPPYAYECDGKACGMDVEMVSQVLSRLVRVVRAPMRSPAQGWWLA